jgi:hypothetical protein
LNNICKINKINNQITSNKINFFYGINSKLYSLNHLLYSLIVSSNVYSVIKSSFGTINNKTGKKLFKAHIINFFINFLSYFMENFKTNKLFYIKNLLIIFYLIFIV